MTAEKPKIDVVELRVFVSEFEAESDRAAVILGAAKLDLLLYQVLGRVFSPPPTGIDELLDGDAPLSTFSAKINLAHRLGLIDAPFARALHLVRRIRNAFAYELSGSSLNSSAHKDRVKELLMPFRGLPFVQEFEKAFLAERKQSGLSAEFRTVLGIMIGRLENAVVDAEQIRYNFTYTLIRDDWKEPEASDTQERQEQSG